MARNYRELQAKMDSASRADNQRRVREELKRMALEELRSARQLTQADLAEMLDVPQSSISRIERRSDMYLSTLRNYIHALGGVLQIQAVFPDGGAVLINRFGEYEDQMYVVWAQAEGRGVYRLLARPFLHQGNLLASKALKASGFVKTMKTLNISEPQIADIRKSLESPGSEVLIGSRTGGDRIFNVPDLVAAGFEAASTEPAGAAPDPY